MNVELLREIVKHISEEPQRFIMSEGIVKTNDPFTDEVEAAGRELDFTVNPPCGTMGCIAGTAVLISGELTEEYEGGHFLWGPVRKRAESLLQIDGSQSLILFYLDRWPYRFQLSFAEATNQAERVAVAAERIEHFINTGGTQ